MHKNLVLVILLTLALLSVAHAVPDNAISGPYNISFDMGMPKTVYDKQITAPESTESLGGEKRVSYRMTIQNKTSKEQTLSISIVNYEEELPLLTGSVAAYAIEQILSKTNVRNIETSTRIIDGVNGGIGQGDLVAIEGLFKVYVAGYVLPFDQNSMAQIISSFPWDEGTLSFLKTLHVERINATS